MTLKSITYLRQRGLLAQFVCNVAFISFLLCSDSVFAQQELQIHHINVENGDATMIGIYDKPSHTYVTNVLIDGGKPAADSLLLPYLKTVTGNATPHFKYVILTHYHNDHYTGLLALGKGDITADSLVDPGAYDFHTLFPNQPQLVALTEAKPISLKVAAQWTNMIKKATSGHFLKGHTEALVSFGTTNKSSLGHKLLIGTVGGLQVTLECVAGWGNTLNDGAKVPDPHPEKDNANNFSLAFIVRCGEFRYFIGGDMGGSEESYYIDQEDALISYLAKDLPAVHSINGQAAASGHSCGFKADHHGSNYSNTVAFMTSMRPTIVITSAGNDSGWHLPQVGFIDKIAALQPLSLSNTTGVFNQGVFFTNLYDWGGTKNSLTEATKKLANTPGISFDYGNASGLKASYAVKVKPDHLTTESDFEVDRVDISHGITYTTVGSFMCHKK